MSNSSERAGAPVIVRLRTGRDRSLRRRHPWIFSGAIDRVEGEIASGLAEVYDALGHWLGRGLWNRDAELAVRILSWNAEQPVDEGWMLRLADAAIRRRRDWIATRPDACGDTDAWRLIFSEADGLSGLILDAFGDVFVLKIAARGWIPFAPALVAHLRAHHGARAVVVSAEPDTARREGFKPEEVAPLGDAVADTVPIREKGLRFEAHPISGQKTGFFLDQRENRARVAALARGRRVLSVYCYTGGFEVHAARAGAAAIFGVDASAAALERARRHHALNATACPVEYLRADAPQALRQFREEKRVFDLVIVDPPRLVWSRSQREQGMRAYKDVNRLAMELLTPGGILATFSCSGLVTHVDFATMLGWAALDADREVRILEWLGQPFDHPIHTAIPETAYLKGALCRVE